MLGLHNAREEAMIVYLIKSKITGREIGALIPQNPEQLERFKKSFLVEEIEIKEPVQEVTGTKGRAVAECGSLG